MRCGGHGWWENQQRRASVVSLTVVCTSIFEVRSHSIGFNKLQMI